MILIIGLPLFYLELYLGQYTGLGPIHVFRAISPFFGGVGYCSLAVITLISIYYMVIIAWSLFYTIVSIAGNLGWGSCENEFNTIYCYSGEYDAACRLNNTGAATDLTYYLGQCMSIGNICELNGFQRLDGRQCLNGTEPIPWTTNVTRILASEEYFNERVLGRGDANWTNWGTIQWHMVGCLFLGWLVTFFCIIKGIKTAGKVVYFTALFPYVMLTALLVRGVTLDGAVDGIIFYLTPKWENLLDAGVWGDAASQTFYSFGVATGSLISLASYNNYNNNCHFDAVFVGLTNFLTSIYAGFAIFSVLGFQAYIMGVSIDDVAEQGPGLAFVAYPEALLQMPIPQFWSIMFFFMLFILGLGSQFVGVEAVNTAIVDHFPQYRSKYWMVTGFTCFTGFLLGIPMCFSGGIYMFTLIDWNAASWAILMIGAAEVLSVTICYGANRVIKDLATMDMKLNKVLRFYWKSMWLVFIPITSLAVLIFIFVGWSAPVYEDYVFPLFANLLGWAVGLSTVILFPVGIGVAWYKGYRGKELFTQTPNWKPSTMIDEEPRADSTMMMDLPNGDQGARDNEGFDVNTP